MVMSSCGLRFQGGSDKLQRPRLACTSSQKRRLRRCCCRFSGFTVLGFSPKSLYVLFRYETILLLTYFKGDKSLSGIGLISMILAECGIPISFCLIYFDVSWLCMLHLR
ncbi:unnamed protein product [Musa banksii]